MSKVMGPGDRPLGREKSTCKDWEVRLAPGKSEMNLVIDFRE